MGEVLILSEAEVRSVLDMSSCIDAVEEAFVALSTGRASLPGVISLKVPDEEAEIHIKAGHLHGEPFYATKFASWFPRNASGGRVASDGMVALFDATSGAPAAFLIDHGYITDLRTGAAGGVAARQLAPREPSVVAVIGAGTQARYQVDALARVRSFGEVRVWGRNPDRARRCAEGLRSQPSLPPGCRVEISPSIEAAVAGAQVVITCTASAEPLVRAGWLAKGAHVTALGSDGPDKQELDAEVLARADLVVVDSRPQCAAIGELHHAIDAGLLTEERAAELGEIVAGKAAGRTSEDQLTVCDLTGVGAQDVAAANLVMARATRAALGRRIVI